MPLSPFNITSESDDADGNPWGETTSGRDRTLDESLFNPSTDSSRSPMGWRAHTRSHTTAGHPLRPASPDTSEHGSSLDLHETRPSLRRVINASRTNSEGDESDDLSGGSSGPNELETKKETDAEVIVHQVQPTDSLPGVALKYNIPLAALRSANKLWASDTIHLREILYIPVQAVTSNTSKCEPSSPRPRPGLPSPPPHSTPNIRTQSSSRMRRSASEWGTPTDTETTTTHPSTAYTVSASANSTIKRVPLSELSFFPPSSSSALSPPSRPGSRPISPTSPSRLRPNASRFNTISSLSRASSPAMPFFSGTAGGSGNRAPTLALTSFLNGARDEIISRLSFDSARGSSDTGDEPEVEMEVVRPIGTHSRTHDDWEGPEVHDVRSKQNRVAEPQLERDGVVVATPRKLKPKVVRTVQLQPSPKMQIPVADGADKAPNGNGAVGIVYGSRAG